MARGTREPASSIALEPPFELTPQEQTNPLWLKLKGYFEEQLQSQRERNDGISNDEQETAVIRGHIEFLKRVISLGDEPPEIDG